MTTALDTNIVFDILLPGAPHRAGTRQAIIDAERAGAVVVGEAVYSEIAAHFRDDEDLARFLTRIRVWFVPSSPAALFSAGLAWRAYTGRRPAQMTCPACGTVQSVQCVNCGTELRPRQHVLADFLVGAHALHQADRLLTRDRGFYATYFPTLTLM